MRLSPTPLLGFLLTLAVGGLLGGCGGSSGSAGAPGSPAPPPAIATFWVAPDGADSGPGTESAPFRTLERARDAVRSLGAGAWTGDVAVVLRGGEHRLERPLVLDARDSGRNGHDVVYRAAPGEKPVLTGSVPVTGWSLADPQRGIFRAAVGARRSRQLYVNGRRAVRARTSLLPAGFRPSFYYLDGVPFPVGIEFIPTPLNPSGWQDPAAWSRPQDVEAVLSTQWKMIRVPVNSVLPHPGYAPDPVLQPALRTGLLTMREPAWSNANLFVDGLLGQPDEWSFWQVSWFENAYAFLDEPGEWYLDPAAGWLYYLPLPGEDLARARVELPVLEVLVDGQGEPGRPVEHLRFEGLTFAHATWLAPSGEDGYVADQSGFRVTGGGHTPNSIGHVRELARTPGNVRFRFAHHVQFRGNVFEHLGAVALDLDTGSQGNLVADNLFEDVSSAAVQVGGVGPDDAHPGSDAYLTRDNTVTNNLVRQTGREFLDAAGIFLGFTRNSLVSQNTLQDVPWSGIAVGWGWGLLDPGMFPGLPGAKRGDWGTFDTPTPNSGNRILNNRIDGFLQALWDGGAIYTTGQQGTSMDDPLLLEGNVATNKRPRAGGNTWYTDGGSRYVRLRRNVAYGNPKGVTDFGPPPQAGDPLPFQDYSVLGGIPYGSDTGGCVTYGDLDYVDNYWTDDAYFSICPSVVDGVQHPVNLSYSGNHLLTGPQDLPADLLDAAGVRYRPASIPPSRWVLPADPRRR